MKTLYFDCSSGISGNMTLGALTEIIGDENFLIEELKMLNVHGYHIEIKELGFECVTLDLEGMKSGRFDK